MAAIRMGDKGFKASVYFDIAHGGPLCIKTPSFSGNFIDPEAAELMIDYLIQKGELPGDIRMCIFADMWNIIVTNKLPKMADKEREIEKDALLNLFDVTMSYARPLTNSTGTELPAGIISWIITHNSWSNSNNPAKALIISTGVGEPMSFTKGEASGIVTCTKGGQFQYGNHIVIIEYGPISYEQFKTIIDWSSSF